MKKIFRFCVQICLFIGILSIIPTFAQSNNTLVVEQISIASKNQINVVFNDQIDASTIRVSIQNQITNESFSPSQTRIKTGNSNIIELLFASDLNTSTTYKLTIISAISKNGKTISAGVDAVKEFITPQDFPKIATPVISQQNTSQAQNTSSVSGSVEAINNEWKNQTGNVSGENIWTSQSTTDDKNTPKPLPSSNAKELPTTGAEVFIFLIFSIIISSIIIWLKNRKA